jgi:hypothetical protein
VAILDRLGVIEMALSLEQQQGVAQQWCQKFFAPANMTARFSTDDVLTAVQAVDAGLDTPLNTVVSVVGGTATVFQAVTNLVPAAFNSVTTPAQQISLAMCVLMARASML